jgi:hypothetical protein
MNDNPVNRTGNQANMDIVDILLFQGSGGNFNEYAKVYNKSKHIVEQVNSPLESFTVSFSLNILVFFRDEHSMYTCQRNLNSSPLYLYFT